jgi:hypothetical protein
MMPNSATDAIMVTAMMNGRGKVLLKGDNSTK